MCHASAAGPSGLAPRTTGVEQFSFALLHPQGALGKRHTHRMKEEIMRMDLDRRTILKLPLLAAGAPAVVEQGLATAARQLRPRVDFPALLRFGVIGDSGSGKPAQHRVAGQMKRLHRVRSEDPWRFILTMGDNIYENGNSNYFERKFIDVYRELLDDGVQFHSTLGNHDIRYKGGAEQLQEEAFGYIGGQDEYEFSAGPTLEDGKELVRFICLNSTRWVEAIEKGENKAVERLLSSLRERLRTSDGYRWNIIYFHHAIHSYIEDSWFLPRGHGSNPYLQRVLEPEIIEHADVVLAGHEHFYQKIRPIKGVHHITSGAAGKRRRGVRSDHPDVEGASPDYHFMDLGLTEDTLYFQAINDSGLLVHSGEIRNRRARQTKQIAKLTDRSVAHSA